MKHLKHSKYLFIQKIPKIKLIRKKIFIKNTRSDTSKIGSTFWVHKIKKNLLFIEK